MALSLALAWIIDLGKRRVHLKKTLVATRKSPIFPGNVKGEVEDVMKRML